MRAQQSCAARTAHSRAQRASVKALLKHSSFGAPTTSNETLRLRNSSPRAFQRHLTRLLTPWGCPFTSGGPVRSTLTMAGAHGGCGHWGVGRACRCGARWRSLSLHSLPSCFQSRVRFSDTCPVGASCGIGDQVRVVLGCHTRLSTMISPLHTLAPDSDTCPTTVHSL